MSSPERLAAIRDELDATLSSCLSVVQADLGADDSNAANATRLLAYISAAKQLTTMVMAKTGEMAKAEEAKAAGKDGADKTLLKLSMGTDALVASIESLAKDLKTPA